MAVCPQPVEADIRAPGNFAVMHKTLPFGDVLECLLDLRENP